MRAATEIGSHSEVQKIPAGSKRSVYGASDRSPQPALPKGRDGSLKKPYSRFPKVPLEWKIQAYVQLLDEGWSRNYARAKAGLKMGRIDYKKAMSDPRVIAAHDRNYQAFCQKQRGKLG